MILCVQVSVCVSVMLYVSVTVKCQYVFVCVCVCVCVCVLWVCPLLAEKVVTEVALMYLSTLQPTNKHCRQTCLCLLDDGSALRVSNHRFLLPTSHNWSNFIKPNTKLICSSVGKHWFSG